MEFSSARHITIAEARKTVPTKDGKLYAGLFRHGTLEIEIYAPKKIDLQKPHSRDEVYVVVSGSGWFAVKGNRVRFAAGDILFAAAGEEHRFEDFTDDFVTWVVFYGPEGGERGR